MPGIERTRRALNASVPRPHQERRRHERFEPRGNSIAQIESSVGSWVASVINLSDGGIEVCGVSYDGNDELAVNVEITFDGCMVYRTGLLKRVRRAGATSHIVVFDDGLAIDEGDCLICDSALATAASDLGTTVLSAVACPECIGRLGPLGATD